MRCLTPSQSFHVCVLVYVPHFDRTVMRCAVKVMSSSPEGKTLKWNEHEPTEDLRVAPNRIQWEDFTDTGPLCPVNLYRCLHVSASQIIISLFISPVAYRKNGLLVENDCEFLQTVAGLLTKYLASDETAMHRMWPVCPTCRSSVPFLPPGIVRSFFPLSTSPVEI